MAGPTILPDDVWTDEHVGRLVPGDVVLIVQVATEKLEGVVELNGVRKPAVRPGTRSRIHGRQRIRAEVVDVVPVLSPSPHDDAYRGYDRRVEYEVLASEGTDAPPPGQIRVLLQRSAQATARNGRDRTRSTRRLAGSGPADRAAADGWRARVDLQADNLEPWRGLRETIAAECYGQKPRRRTDEYLSAFAPAEARGSEEEKASWGADVWAGRVPMPSDVREALERRYDPDRQPVSADWDDWF